MRWIDAEPCTLHGMGSRDCHESVKALSRLVAAHQLEDRCEAVLDDDERVGDGESELAMVRPLADPLRLADSPLFGPECAQLVVEAAPHAESLLNRRVSVRSGHDGASGWEGALAADTSRGLSQSSSITCCSLGWTPCLMRSESRPVMMMCPFLMSTRSRSPAQRLSLRGGGREKGSHLLARTWVWCQPAQRLILRQSGTSLWTCPERERTVQGSDASSATYALTSGMRIELNVGILACQGQGGRGVCPPFGRWW